MTHPKLAPWPDGTQRQTSPTSRPTSHNASNGRPQSTLVDVIDTPKATSHKATTQSHRSSGVEGVPYDRFPAPAGAVAGFHSLHEWGKRTTSRSRQSHAGFTAQPV